MLRTRRRDDDLPADSLMPSVGQRAGEPSDRSNTSTGKFDSRPPSTQVTVPAGYDTPSKVAAGTSWRTGRKKNGIDIEPHGVDDELGVGVNP